MFKTLSILIFVVNYFVAFTLGLNYEGLALLLFKQSIVNQTDAYLASWNSSDANPCLWRGITCDNQKVVSLSIPNRRLTGILLPSLRNLSALRRINLKNNNFHGHLPDELFDAKPLQSLVLSGNSFSGSVTKEIGKLRNLQSLDLSRNAFNGSIPSAMALCKRLKMLILSQNNFTGNFPDGFGESLTNLQKLNLSFNGLTGSIPEDFGNLSNLEGALDLSQNFFSGFIPESLGNLPETIYIDLSYNNLSGSIPKLEVLINAGPTAFQGNPFLCGLPLNVSCPGRNSFSAYPQSLINPSQVPGKHHHSRLCISITAIGGTLLGFSVLSLLLSCYFRKTVACAGNQTSDCSQQDEKPKLTKDIFWFKNTVLENSETFSEKLEQYSFVLLDSEVKFELDQLLTASAFLLGKSRIGLIYKVVMENGLSLAVRRFGDDIWQRFKEFQVEVDAIGRIRHLNIVNLQAYCSSSEEKLLIYNYLPNGDLASAIHGKAGNLQLKQLSWPVRLRIIIGIARGLTHIHEFGSKRFFHGDLNPSKILLGENMEPKISGFGLGRLLASTDEIHSVSCYSSPISSRKFHYQPPEASKIAKPSQKWDVYAYGLILLEMVTMKSPVLQMNSSERDWIRFVRLAFQENKLVGCVLDPVLVRSVDVKDEIVDVIRTGLACVCEIAEKRPCMRNVVESLERLYSTQKK